MSRLTTPLAELRSRLRDRGIEADTHKVATIFLGLAHTNDWLSDPAAMTAWFEQLAMELMTSEPRLADRRKTG